MNRVASLKAINKSLREKGYSAKAAYATAGKIVAAREAKTSQSK